MAVTIVQQPATANQNQVQNQTGSRLLYVIILAGSALSLLLQCIGLVTPGWQVVDLNVQARDLRFSMGLWYVNYCTDDTCDSTDLDTFWEQRYSGPKSFKVPHDMMKYCIMTVIAALSMVVEMLCISKLLCCSAGGIYKNEKVVWQAILATTALSAILALMASILYGLDIQEAHNAFDGSEPSPYSEPWSLMITGVGGIIAGLVWVVMVLETCRAMTIINRDQGQGMIITPTWTHQDYVAWQNNRPTTEYNSTTGRHETKYR